MEMVQLANGKDVPKVCVDALNEFEDIWPGASFANARPALARAVLEALAVEGDAMRNEVIDVRALERGEVENMLDMELEDFQWARLAPYVRLRESRNQAQERRV